MQLHRVTICCCLCTIGIGQGQDTVFISVGAQIFNTVGGKFKLVAAVSEEGDGGCLVIGSHGHTLGRFC